MIFAQENGRIILKEDPIFGINARAKAMIKERGKENVVNGTIGSLLDDDGNLIVLSSVADVFASLSPREFAEYAPIGGLESYQKAIIKDAMGSYEPKSITKAVSAPGGTGAIRNVIANYSKPGDRVLVSDWFWATYKTIAREIVRDVESFELFNYEGKFNVAAFSAKVNQLLSEQDCLVAILNTPAHNPTGYSLTDEDWINVREVFKYIPKDKKLTLLVDTAYIEFAGDSEKYRSFLKIVDDMPENIFVTIAHSLSKGYTMYGLRAGATICLAHDEEQAEEFRRVMTMSSRGTWSNCSRVPQVILSKIYADPELKAKVDEERKYYRDMLLRRGAAIEEASKAVGLKMVPFDTGFFASFPCKDPKAASQELEKDGIFLVPLAKGLRVAIAAISEEKCRMIPSKIKAAIDKTGGVI